MKKFLLNKNIRKWLIIGAVFVIVAVVLLVVFLKKDGSSNHELNQSEAVLDIEAEGLTETEGLQGLLSKPFEDESKLVDEDMSIDLIGAYNGLFVEDGSDVPIENALSIVVTNHGDKTLQIALITLTDGEKTYEFQVTTLPAGASALVLEKNQAVYEAGKTLEVSDYSSGYFASTTLMEDKLEISAADGNITIKNIGEETYSKLYVYYKLKKQDGTYMGGITYRTPVENLAPGESQEVVAAHYRTGSGHIIMVEAAAE